MFTQEQINEIEHRLAKKGAKDTQLPSAKTPLTGDESMAIVQERENRLVPIGSIVNTDGGIFNVSEYLKAKTEVSTSVILTLSEAIEACPSRAKKAGQIIIFIDKDKEWQRYQYQGYNIENWNQLTLWKDLNNVSEDMPVSEDVMIFNITEYMPGGSKSTQAIWAGIYTIDGITPVSQYRVIFGCDASLGIVEGVDMDASDTLAIIDIDTDDVAVFSYILFVGNSIDGYRYQTTINSNEEVPDWIAKAFGNNSSYILANIASLERRVNAKLADKAFIVRVDDYLDSSKEMPNGYFMFEQQPVSQIRVLYDSDVYLLYIQAAVDGTGTMYFAFENADEYYDSWRYLNQYTEESCPSHVLEAFGLNVATSNKKGMMSATDKNNLDGSFKNVSYNANTKRLIFTKNNNTTVELDATPFIKDGMVNSVSIVDGYLVITFNTDSGKEDIEIPLTDIFNPDNYYTKAQANSLLGNKVDKEQGKGLSTNDYTTEEKNKVANIPTALSELTEDATHRTVSDVEKNTWNNKGNITGITMNGVSKGTSGVVDLGNVLTAHQDITGKANKIPMPPVVHDLIIEGTTQVSDVITLIKGAFYPRTYTQIDSNYVNPAVIEFTVNYTGELRFTGRHVNGGILEYIKAYVNGTLVETSTENIKSATLNFNVEANDVVKVEFTRYITGNFTGCIGNLSITSAGVPKDLVDVYNSLAPVATSGSYNDLSDKPDLSSFITRSVDDLTNYYLKSETYTKNEVLQLIGAIQQFHYEVYPTLPQTGASNVLYLIGPTGTGTDKYEEYVYANNDFTKIGDTSIDLSGYVTTQALNTALADYVTSSALSTTLANYYNKTEVDGLFAGKENVMPITTATGATLTAVVGNYYRLDNVGTLAITLPTITGATKLQAITFLLVCGSSALVTFASQGSETILYQEDFALEADTTYEVTALWNGSEWTLSRVIYE